MIDRAILRVVAESILADRRASHYPPYCTRELGMCRGCSSYTEALRDVQRWERKAD